MYPYNRKTQLYHTSIGAKEKAEKKENSPDLSTDRRLLELLQLAKQDAAQLERKYASLLQEDSLTEAAEILRTMETDTKKHQRILREILFTIFSDTYEDILEEIAEKEAETKTAEELLEELLLTEMDDIIFYRILLSVMDTDDLRELLFEVLTDKQNHTSALNYLYAKYFSKTTGQ